MNEIEIRLLVSDSCDVCSSVKRRLALIAARHPGVFIKELTASAEMDEAIDFALEYDIEIIPSFEINGQIFAGEDWTDRSVERALLHNA